MNETTKSYLYLQALIDEVPLSSDRRQTALAHLSHLQQRETALFEKVQEFQSKLDDTKNKIKDIKNAKKSN